MFEWLQANGDSFFLNMLYDIFKFSIGFLVAQWLERVYKKNKYGGWTIELVKGEESILKRDMTPMWVERIFKDDYDLSVYIKGFISPYFFLNIDITCDKAKEIGLIKIDADKQTIVINQLKNPIANKS